MERFELVAGINCWSVEPCDKIKVLVDGAEYFSTLVQVAEQAQRSISILGWDIDSRTHLLREPSEDVQRYQFGSFIERLAERRPELEIRILTWDYALIYAFERELVPSFRFDSMTYKNIHFYVDDQHPIGASHHQKVVVVDDQVAFVGGLDLCGQRWDTSEHRAYHEWRSEAGCEHYAPFHDVQVMLQGMVVEKISELFWMRWRRRTGQPRPRTKRNLEICDVWPSGLEADFLSVRAGISRTFPPYCGHRGIFEVRQLYSDSIRSAREYIYVENQYFTSQFIVSELAQVLKSEQGPEVVMVLPKRASGWLEESTMGKLRSGALNTLRKADLHERLHVFYPEIPELGDDYLRLHSKVMVIDDEFVRIGSSNLSNRSMGFDTECDAFWVADGKPEACQKIRQTVVRLLSEHGHIQSEDLLKVWNKKGSLSAALYDLRPAKGRRLVNLFESEKEGESEFVPDQDWVDPERPLRISRPLRDRFYRFGIIELWLSVAVIGLLLAVALWSPVNEYITAVYMARLQQFFGDNVWGFLSMLGAYVVGGFLVVPVTLLLVVTVIAFDGWAAFAVCLLGAVIGSLGSYGLGYLMGPSRLVNLTAGWLKRSERYLKHSSLLTIIVVRMLPVAPYGVINFAAGAVKVRLRHFIPGTLIGFLPGVITLSLIGTLAKATFKNPVWSNWLGLLVAVSTSLWILTWIKRRLSSHYA